MVAAAKAGALGSWAPVIKEEVRWFAQAMRTPEVRSLRRFAEEEVIIGEGDLRGTRFRCDTLPWTGLLFDEIDSERWRRIIIRGCVQGGKTLCGFVIPCLWHLFEHREVFICGVPTMDMAFDKWRKEIEPTILATPKFKSLLPERGRGSRGGNFEAMPFRNGAELKFMPGHGGDEKRSGYTARVLGITEADRLDEAGEQSREAAPVYQMEARTASYANRARFYGECTTTTDAGFVYRESKAGTDSQIMCPCPNCEVPQCLSRENLIGYEDAETKMEAAELASFVCPLCLHKITDEERRDCNRAGVLVHRGQTIHKGGIIEGEPPKTDTLGFTFAAYNNLLWPTSYIAEKEWERLHSEDFLNQEKRMRQWYWALPAEPDTEDLVPLTIDDVIGRAGELSRGTVPEETTYISAGFDLGARRIHFVVMAWLPGGRGYLADFGTLPVNSRELGVRKGLLMALEKLDERLSRGYKLPSGKVKRVGWRVGDAGWKDTVLFTFMRAKRAAGCKAYIPARGRGQSVPARRGGYSHPTKTTKQKPKIGEQWHVRFEDKAQLFVIHHNADHWKTNVHEGFTTPPDQPGGIESFDPATTSEKSELRLFAQHLCSERAQTKVVPERGPVIVWTNETGKQNHYLDGTGLAFIGGALGGVKILAEKRAKRRAQLIKPDN